MVLMPFHILLPNIDKENPSTLSNNIITDILRGDMGFNGVVITDDMTMGAIVENYDIGDAAVKSIIAGADIVLVCHDYEKQVEVMEALKSAVIEGFITEAALDGHVYRILILKEEYGIADEETTPVKIKEINDRISVVLDKHFK